VSGSGYVGRSVLRGDAARILTGRGRYVGDLSQPGMLHVAFVRSPHAHARIISVDVEQARRLPGVAGVLTGPEAAALCKPWKGIL
jgi:aerobic carbon-monoxide dehydrogenase large subunit